MGRKEMKNLLDWIDKRLPLSEFIDKHVTGYPTPANLNYLWNFGSLAGTFYAAQVVAGIWLAMFYKPSPELAFDSVQYIMRDVHWGWLLRYLHANGTNFIFAAIYVHMGRSMYYGSYRKPRELIWWIGVLIFICFMAEAFMGYVLPWGQMSYWAATAITNIFSAIPVAGAAITTWVRGDFAVGDATLNRFFAFHTMVFPIAIIGLLVVLHLSALHRVGSNNPDGVELDKDGPGMVPFSPYYITKDLWVMALALLVFFYFVFFQPMFFLEPINSEPANMLKTPLDIKAEWYLVPFYSILKSVPGKLGGVLAMGGAVLVLFLMPFLDRSEVRSARYRPVKRALTWIFFVNFILLGIVGAYPPDAVSFIGVRMHSLGLVFTLYYFLYFFTMPFVSSVEPAAPRTGGKEDAP